MSKTKEFPRPLARLSGLEGGAYGEVVLKALSRTQMELDLGNEFVLFNHEQARALAEAVRVFLELHECDEHGRERREERREEREEKVIEHAVDRAVDRVVDEVVEEVVEARPRRRGRR